MSAIRCPEEQTHLFPADVMAQIASHPKPHAPLQPLPHPTEKSVDMKRVCKILGCDDSTVKRLIAAEKIRGYKIKGLASGRAATRIEYDSVLEYCDSLRLTYHLRLRQPVRAGSRPKDDEVLPWPLKNNLTAKEVADHLDISLSLVFMLIEAGAFEAYKLVPGQKSKSPYRISRVSFDRYLESLKTQ